MRIVSDDQILDLGFRTEFLKEITDSLNTTRKQFMKRRYDVFKDDTKKYVLEYFQNESAKGEEVIAEIKNRASNISFCRKIIDQKCMVYKDGAKREIADGNEQLQNSLGTLEDVLNINSVMKKTNKYEELFKNALVQVMPYETSKGWKVKLNVLPPFLYDVIEDANNPEEAKVVVFSNFNPERSQANYAQPGMSGYRNESSATSTTEDINQVIEDLNRSEGDELEYVWWSDNYHFTTNSKGEIIPGRQEVDLINPVGELPFVDFSREKDGSFWAVGGEDLVEGSILLNVLLTDLYYIAKFQGMGIGYMFGKGIPKNLKVGPSTFVTLEVEQGDPTPQLGFASSNPPIDSHIKMIEGYLAYLLSTNNLDAGTIIGTLTASSATSGVQEAIKRSENLDDVEDQQESYRDNEPVLFRLVFKWLNMFYERGLLAPEFSAVGKIPEETKVVVRFNKPSAYQGENEKLAAIEKRLELGISSKVGAVIADNPGMTKEEAEELLDTITLETAKERKQKIRLYIPEQPLMNKKKIVEEEDEDGDIEDNTQDKASAE